MLEIHKQYVLDDEGKAIAVQIPIAEFEQIEDILEASGQIISVAEQSGSNRHSSDETQEECELVDVDGILVVKAQGAENIDIVEFIKEQREERIRHLGGW